MPVFAFNSGEYRGAYFNDAPLDAGTIASFASIRDWLQPGKAIASLGRHQLAFHEVAWSAGPLPVAIKSFARGPWWRDRYFARRGSKAERSFRAAVRLAERGVGTPRPLVFVDRWSAGRLVESYYVCEYLEGFSSFRDELDRLYREDPLCRRIMSLMETAALAIADMHDSGLCHCDLGNQNILLRRLDDDRWGDVRFIDLNRSIIRENLSLAERARDISRIDLPSDFLRVFKCMYFRHQHPTAAFNKIEDRFRRRFARHTASRKYRHPIREARQRKRDALLPFVPRGRELWVWDDRSVQAVSTLLSRDRHRYYPLSNNWHIATGILRSAVPVMKLYRDYRSQCFRKPVDLAGRIGIAIGPDRDDAQEQGFLAQLGGAPVLVRFYAHAGDEANAAALARARAAKAESRSVLAALLQDRASLRDPRRWESFVGRWLPGLAGTADAVEVGHAVNRVKWGVWDIREYRTLIEPVFRLAGGGMRLCGPAAIDFEYHFLPALLDQVPGTGTLDALSHHLYVDRRGAPENKQGAYSTVEKCALLKAIAGASRAVKDDRVIVSEVNWPILGTAEYSPVNSPYIIPNSHTNDPSVDEEAYANYMIRYYALALCSGMVDQVYWWRLVSRGFGLIDDREQPWRARPAFHALRTFTGELGSARYSEKLASPAHAYALRFERLDGTPIILAWSHAAAPVAYRLPCRIERMLSRDGIEQPAPRETVMLSGSPVYLIGSRS